VPAILRKVAEVLADGLSIGVIRQQITYKLKARNRRNHEFGNAEVRKMVLRAATLSDATGDQEA
jgi:hypothetical protein